jgi:7,8-dihydroneopterin aldolase/epimerase/oxygenase
MNDYLTLQVHDLEVQVLTGIYSQETHLPQPLRISIDADLEMADHYAPETPLDASLNYMILRDAAVKLPKGVHFTLIEAVAEHIFATLFAADERVKRLTVKIIKLAIAEDNEAIGITMARSRP